MKQKILLILALFAIVAGARAQILYKRNVVVEKNELLESNVTIWKRSAVLGIRKEYLDIYYLQPFAQHPTEIKDIEYYISWVQRTYDENGDPIEIPLYNLYYYQKKVGNVRNSFRGEFDLYKNPDGTPHHATMKELEEGTMSSGDIAIHWIINEVEYEGLTYPVTEVGDGVCSSGSGEHYTRVVGITMQNLTTVGEFSFYGGSGYTMIFQNLETLNLPNLTTVGRESFFSGSSSVSDGFSSLKVLYLPNLETVENDVFNGCYYFLESIYVPKLKKAGELSFYMGGNTMMRSAKHTDVYLPIDVLSLKSCFNKGTGGITYHILDNGGKINKLPVDAVRVGVKGRFLVPSLGKAQALAELWSLRFNFEVYSPVPVSKANDGYGTMVIEPGDAWASYTQDGVTYANYYDFNRALTAADVEKPFDGTDFNAPEDYRHKWFVATSYTDNNKQEGTLTITSPNKYGVRPGDGFLLQGPAFSGTGDGVMWVPVATVPHNNYPNYYLESPNPYTDTNYFKAGTGAAVAKESDGCRNFYFSASMQGFYQCNNTVIPTNRAYLALPSEMTANAKQISFVIDDGESEVTGIVSLTPNPSPEGEGGYHSLDGRKLDGKPTTKGIYIHNGRKEVIR